MITLPYPVPSGPDWRIDWDAVFASPIGGILRKMDGIRQNPVWHGEGDVLVHTRYVCEALCATPAFRVMDAQGRAELFTAALLHDIGKLTNTRQENGEWVSPGHAGAGARAARKFLWQTLDLAGTEEKRRFRETVCALVQFHSIPSHFLSRPEPERFIPSIAAEGCGIPGFSLRKLAALVRADFLGREADEVGRLLDAQSLFV